MDADSRAIVDLRLHDVVALMSPCVKYSSQKQLTEKCNALAKKIPKLQLQKASPKNSEENHLVPP
jgi:hypothetical protein